ncbi:hypothetical protein ACFOY4_01695 [Actinomadura syzygii]|uniref:Uncharacterized protein n=1 Tax=Actinomadura syzygii TaxID=1427538 RepID=A0A5D0TTB4_9ACTN|nr:hypothetical protein [Actinomadura syzygii]TYC08545.1 hypothetical protein FXF65_37250 [Actinomadura syzygii]
MDSDRGSRGGKQLQILQGEILTADPRQEHPYEPFDSFEQPVDAEWTEGPPPHGETSWRVRWDRAKTFFTTGPQRRWEERQRARATERERLGAEPRLSERDELRLLRENIADAGERYMESLRLSDIHAPGFTDDERAKKVSALHSVYAQMMVASCLRPMQQGVNAAAIVRAASTMTTMYLLSPTFQNVVKEYAEPVREAIQNRIDAKARSKMDRAQYRARVANRFLAQRNKGLADLGDRRIDLVDPRSLMSAKWQRRFDDLQFRERGNREMFTARSAAMTEVALTENAFARMRHPGADTNQIATSYNAMIALLYKQAEDDGLTRQDVAQASRVVLGERVRDDPRVQVMIEGMAHGRLRMSPPHHERIAGTDRVHKVWRGTFENYLGDEVVPTRYRDPDNQAGVLGAFTLRSPMSATAHQGEMATTMAQTMANAIERGDMAAFNQDMAGYMLGYVARAEKFDGDGVPGAVPDRLFQSRTMLAAMTADGFNDKELQETYANAYVEAIEAVRDAYPEFSRQWGQTYGENWQDFMHRATVDPRQAHADWQAHQAAGGTGAPGSERGAGRERPGPPHNEQQAGAQYQA